MTKTPSMSFEYTPQSVIMEITMPMVRKTLRQVQAQLLSRAINGGDRRLDMDCVTKPDYPQHSCRMAACIGGWTSLFLLGFDTSLDVGLEGPADSLFSKLINLDAVFGNGRLNDLFYDYSGTDDFNEPNVAATAIGRYLRGRDPWPCGKMPNVLAYTKRAPAKKAAKSKANKKTR